MLFIYFVPEFSCESFIVQRSHLLRNYSGNEFLIMIDVQAETVNFGISWREREGDRETEKEYICYFLYSFTKLLNDLSVNLLRRSFYLRREGHDHKVCLLVWVVFKTRKERERERSGGMFGLVE